MQPPFVNIHTHTATGLGIELVNADDCNSLPDSDFASTGLHPWQVGKCDHRQTLDTIDGLCREGKLAAIGEAGLDRAIETDIERQKDVFAAQLDLAKQYHLPMIIHCVRAYSDFLQIMQREPSVKMIFHGFNGNATTANQLLRHGAMLSFGHQLLNNNELQKTFANIPNDCIFLETDTKDIGIDDIYNFAAELKNVSTDELKQIIFNNLTSIFSNRWATIG